VFYKANLQEVDFFVADKNLNIQVCYELNQWNFDREIQPLKKQEWEKILIYFEKNWQFAADDVKIVSFVEFLNGLFFENAF
jgi:predicted AAA+ superfamily ATPase